MISGFEGDGLQLTTSILGVIFGGILLVTTMAICFCFKSKSYTVSGNAHDAFSLEAKEHQPVSILHLYSRDTLMLENTRQVIPNNYNAPTGSLSNTGNFENILRSKTANGREISGDISKDYNITSSKPNVESNNNKSAKDVSYDYKSFQGNTNRVPSVCDSVISMIEPDEVTSSPFATDVKVTRNSANLNQKENHIISRYESAVSMIEPDEITTSPFADDEHHNKPHSLHNTYQIGDAEYQFKGDQDQSSIYGLDRTGISESCELQGDNYSGKMYTLSGIHEEGNHNLETSLSLELPRYSQIKNVKRLKPDPSRQSAQSVYHRGSIVSDDGYQPTVPPKTPESRQFIDESIGDLYI